MPSRSRRGRCFCSCRRLTPEKTGHIASAWSVFSESFGYHFDLLDLPEVEQLARMMPESLRKAKVSTPR